MDKRFTSLSCFLIVLEIPGTTLLNWKLLCGLFRLYYYTQIYALIQDKLSMVSIGFHMCLMNWVKVLSNVKLGMLIWSRSLIIGGLQPAWQFQATSYWQKVPKYCLRSRNKGKHYWAEKLLSSCIFLENHDSILAYRWASSSKRAHDWEKVRTCVTAEHYNYVMCCYQPKPSNDGVI